MAVGREKIKPAQADEHFNTSLYFLLLKRISSSVFKVPGLNSEVSSPINNELYRGGHSSAAEMKAEMGRLLNVTNTLFLCSKDPNTLCGHDMTPISPLKKL